MKNIFKNFFTEKNENYAKAKSGLKNMKKSFDGFIITFPDVTSDEIMFLKEKWEVLPKTISNGVKIMALDFVNNNKELLTYYKPNSYIKPHKHDEFEYGLILKGELVDRFNDKVYKMGDEYIINPKQLHYLASKNGECLVYSILSSDKDYEMNKLPKKYLEKTLNSVI